MWMRCIPLLLLAACSYAPKSPSTTDDAVAPTDGEAPDLDGEAPPSSIVADPYTGARSEGQASALTFSHRVGDNADRVLVVGVSTSFGNTIVESVRFDNVPLVREGSRKAPSQDGRVEIWSLVAPPVGEASIEIALDDASSTIVAGVGSFGNVDQTTSLGAFVSASAMGGDPSLAVTSTAGALSFGIVAWAATGDLVDGAAQLGSWNERNGSIVGAGATSSEASPTFRWIGGSDGSWATAAVTVLPL